MHTNTVLITKDNGQAEPKQILLNVNYLDAEPPYEDNYFIDYNTLDAGQKAIFDSAIALAESFIPPA